MNVGRRGFGILLLIASILPSSGQCSGLAERATFVIFLRDGKTVSCQRKPLSAYGRVGAYGPDGTLTWYDATEVDLERSRKQWAHAEPFSRLDTGLEPGARAPTLRFHTESGTVGGSLVDPNRLTLVEIWTPY